MRGGARSQPLHFTSPDTNCALPQKHASGWADTEATYLIEHLLLMTEAVFGGGEEVAPGTQQANDTTQVVAAMTEIVNDLILIGDMPVYVLDLEIDAKADDTLVSNSIRKIESLLRRDEGITREKTVEAEKARRT